MESELLLSSARKSRKAVIRKSVLHHSKKSPKEVSPSPSPSLSSQSKNSFSVSNQDTNSQEYLENLIRKLFSNPNVKLTNKTDLQDFLPALTSSQDVDIQTYALIGLFLRQFVMGWYPRISHDTSMEFMGELLGVVAHITRNLQQRCQRIDWSKLLLDELPVVLESHVSAIRTSKSRRGSRLSSSRATVASPGCDWYDDPDWTADFLELNSHFAIDQNDAYLERLYCTVLSRSIVCLLVPVEELDSQLSQKLITAIMNDLVLRNVVENLSDSFAIWGIINKVCDIGIDRLGKKNAKRQSLGERLISVGRMVGHLIAYTTSLFSIWPSPGDDDHIKSVLEYSIFSFLACLFEIPVVSPMLYMLLTTLKAYGIGLSRVSHILNNLIHNFIYQVIITESNVITCVSVLRRMMFPKDQTFDMGQRWVPQSNEELIRFRQKTRDNVTRLMEVLPSSNLIAYLVEVNADSVEMFLESLQNKTVNKVLLWSLLDLLLVSIFPELSTYTATDIENHSLT
ncbi:unnamed protein product [Kuraishia capsulata CBS 1993]|uniref:PXA domain-containing protein n=1 Tax=Kuraishia capsulata CBS 1993 TaxID=1382522 RepID=W6MQR9_9ASCO|nr:uncharacterized protein KUCA_T00004682001 [Kuraishia capsulata CBS 1993]CDK28698.1 unnamed protein product [Kuraishia capsulata CBS 1993]